MNNRKQLTKEAINFNSNASKKWDISDGDQNYKQSSLRMTDEENLEDEGMQQAFSGS